MFCKIWNAITGKRHRRVRLVPSSDALPGLWRDAGESVPQANLRALSGAPTEVLMELCDDYWNSYLDDGDHSSVVRDSRICQSALEELASRGPEVIAWARARLRHAGYDARGDAARLFGKLCTRHIHGCDLDACVADLSRLAVRPWEEDTKETEANTAALTALASIRSPRAIPALRQILTSPEWQDDELPWEAAEVLGEIVGVSFEESEDPVEAAREWLRNSRGTDAA
ncbi:MAG TPA: hypothetical protein VML55_24975 [Planctomycetaceae bacterium]|nr:hypothetical protein [Planctomycetaceae bacterium]